MLTRLLTGFAVVAMGICCLGTAASASAAAPYEFEPVLSLNGACGKSAFDSKEDPGCPGGSHPPKGFSNPKSVTIDAYGNEYVASYGDPSKKVAGRIDVFDDAGNFITEVPDSSGPKSIAVDSKGNLYVVEQSEGTFLVTMRYPPTVYEPEAGKIEYDNTKGVVVETDQGLSNSGIAINPADDHLFLVYLEGASTIREYASAGDGNALLKKITTPNFGNSANFLAVDAARDRLFSSYCRDEGSECGVLVFGLSSGDLLNKIDNPPAGVFASTKGWLGLAVDEENGHLFVADLELTNQAVYEFDEDYELVSKLTSSAFNGGNALQIAVSNSPLNPAARNLHYLFVPVPKASGSVLAFSPPAVTEPEIVSSGASSIGETEANLRADIAPNGADTQYVFEVEEEGSVSPRIVGEGTIPGGSFEAQANAVVTGLSPGFAYRFRVHAENEIGFDDAEERFITYSDAPLGSGTCPNQALRMGLSAGLPDCRAYELVSPADTNGRTLVGLPFTGDRFATLQASPQGGQVSFLLQGGVLPGTEGTGGFEGDPYLASRGTSGWTTAAVGISGADSSSALFGAVSPDQGYRFWAASGEGPTPHAQYIRYPDGHSAIVGTGSLGEDPNARGVFITEGGTHVVFQTEFIPPGIFPVQLEPQAPPAPTEAVYDRTPDGVTHVVSLLPGDETPAPLQHANFVGASPDGTGIAFRIGTTLYLRLGNEVTYDIGTGVTFAGVSEGGGRVFYLEGGDLFAFDTSTEETIEFTDGVGNAVPVNVASAGARAYFVSTTAIAEAGENPNGALPEAGEQNLYLSEEGQIRFVATVTDIDVEGELDPAFNIHREGLGLWTEAVASQQPVKDSSRLNPAGSVLLFQSRASLDGRPTGGLKQVYRYDGAANRLHCLSCNPTGAEGSGTGTLGSFSNTRLVPLSDSSFIPNLSHDGRRAFFQSNSALVAGDVDGRQDVYEWEEQGVGGCPRAGGCVYLVSSGHSAKDDYLYGHSTSGDDVFFVTGDNLVGFDLGGTQSVYDARVGGGFAKSEQAPCSGEGCRPGVSSPPPLSPPAKPALGADDNVPKAKRCPKGKHKVKRKGKVHCVKNHRKAGSKKGVGQ